MDWMMPVNEMLKDDITKINYKMMPPTFKGDIHEIRLMQDSLARLICVLGEQSSAAQGLNRVITTADKLRNSLTHILYLMKDPRAKAGKGDVIGMLKVGRKHLFLFNDHGKLCEVEPLCVLDFYVVNNRQRTGYGKVLFDHMLQDMRVSAKELAIDGPSTKMEQFLKKNYGIDLLMRQNNNFAVSPDFFELVPNVSKSGRTTPIESPAVGRFAAPKPSSAIATVIHGVGSYYDDTRNREEVVEIGSGAGAVSPPAEPPSAPEREPRPEPEPEAQPEPEAVASSTKSPERPSTLSVEPVAQSPVPAPAAAALSPAGSTVSRRDSQLTDQGYFDVKFYHNKLW